MLFSDVPRQHWSCCMLGMLAGDKGFHCHASFYAARISSRNSNRAHNNKMLFHGPSANPSWGVNIMATFERCIARHSDEFHKCCYASAVEKRERYRWHYYRVKKQVEEQESEGPFVVQGTSIDQERSRSGSRSRTRLNRRPRNRSRPESAVGKSRRNRERTFNRHQEPQIDSQE